MKDITSKYKHAWKRCPYCKKNAYLLDVENKIPTRTQMGKRDDEGYAIIRESVFSVIICPNCRKVYETEEAGNEVRV